MFPQSGGDGSYDLQRIGTAHQVTRSEALIDIRGSEAVTMDSIVDRV